MKYKNNSIFDNNTIYNNKHTHLYMYSYSFLNNFVPDA